MYIARRELRVPDGKGHLKLIKAGEEVVGFENWDEVARRANLSMEWVAKVDDEQAAPVETKKSKKKSESAQK
jgi:hypothetical protein